MFSLAYNCPEMPSEVTKLQIFVASPGDVQKERDRLAGVVEGLNSDVARSKNLVLELIQWKTHTHPGMGEDAQAVINQQIKPTDIFIGIMWKRFGTPTKRAPSGTVEEFRRAYKVWKKNPQAHIMFYFNQTKIRPDIQELKQLKKVLGFRDSLSKVGLIADYKGVRDFEKQVRSHLSKVVLNWNRGANATGESGEPPWALSSKSVPVWPPPPQAPGLFVGREEGLQELRRRLGIRRQHDAVGQMQPITAVFGIGGVGKTTLAAPLTYVPEVRKAFLTAYSGPLWEKSQSCFPPSPGGVMRLARRARSWPAPMH
jgi:hypothetical protein